MTGPVDTSAVEQLAMCCDYRAQEAHRSMMAQAHERQVAATLRALLAALEETRALKEAAMEVAASRLESIEALCAKLAAVEAERDALAASLAAIEAKVNELPRTLGRDVADRLMPHIAAQLAAARRAVWDEAAREVDCGCAARVDVLARLATDGEKRAAYLCTHGDACCALQAAALRARAEKDITP